MVGGAIALDLAREKNWAIRAVDRSAESLSKLLGHAQIETTCKDIADESALLSVISDADLVVNAMPGSLGYETMRRVIDAARDVVDISFFGEDPFTLDTLAQERGVTAIVDCGVAPGLCNVIAGYVHNDMDRVDSYVCLVGGIPVVRSWPYEYKAVFSPLDVMQEFTRPARFVEYGKLVVRPALSDVELIDFMGVGTLEAFNTDGLRSLAVTLDIPFMKEKTMRYPGHANLARVFRETGLFNTQPVNINGVDVRPIDLTSRLLIEQWRLQEDEEDLTVMQVIIEGEKDGLRERRDFFMLDRFDPITRTTSMARTTGYTCAVAVRQVIAGLFRRKGICPPEYLGATDGCFADMRAELEQRNIQVQEVVTKLPATSEQDEQNPFLRKIA